MSSYIICGAEEVRVQSGQSINDALTEERRRYLGVPERFSLLIDGEKVTGDHIIEDGDTITVEQEESTKGAKKPVKGGKGGGKKPC